MRYGIVLVLAVLAPIAAWAQSSPSYTIESHVFNAGGRPEQGAVSQSGAYAISTDAIGEAVGAAQLSSASFVLDGGTLAPYGPVGEVAGLRFSSSSRLEWDLSANASSYTVYRDTLCAAGELMATQWDDATNPPVGTTFFYLVTATNRLGEEGTGGTTSDGVIRPNTGACP